MCWEVQCLHQVNSRNLWGIHLLNTVHACIEVHTPMLVRRVHLISPQKSKRFLKVWWKDCMFTSAISSVVSLFYLNIPSSYNGYIPIFFPIYFHLYLIYHFLCLLVSFSLFNMCSLEQQHHLRAYKKCRIPGLTQNYLNQICILTWFWRWFMDILKYENCWSFALD